MRTFAARSFLLTLVLISLPLVAAAFGRPAPSPSVPPPPGPGGIWHRVAPGEDLRAIARCYFGSAREWRTLQLANGVGMQPAPGSEIWIPAALTASRGWGAAADRQNGSLP